MLRKIHTWLDQLITRLEKTHIITQEEIAEVNELLRIAVENKHAYLEVTSCDNNLYDIAISLGIKGPINKKNILHDYVVSMLHGLVNMQHARNRNGERIYPHLQISIEPIEKSYNQYYIKITSLPVVLFAGLHTCSLQNCLKKYAQYVNDPKHHRIFTKSEDKTISNSSAVIKDLKQHRIISNSVEYRPKEHGYMPGVIIKTKTSPSKETFVKQFHDLECLDFAILKIAKSCGATVPKIKLVVTKKNCYLFSSSLNNSKKTTNYHYRDLYEYNYEDKDCFFDQDKLVLFKGRKSDGSFSEQYNIDRKSVARFLMLSVIFALTDLRTCNVGILISDANGIKKAKLALLDFATRSLSSAHYGVHVDPIKIHQKKSLVEFIKYYILIDNEYVFRIFQQRILKKNTFLKALINALTEADFIEAFEKISANFKTALDDVKPEIEQVIRKLGPELIGKISDIKRVSHKTWMNNFNVLSEKIELAKKARDENLTGRDNENTSTDIPCEGTGFRHPKTF